MNFEEYAAKPLLADAGIAVPKGVVAATADEALRGARTLGAVVIKAQVPTGKRGKAGGVRAVETPEQAVAAAREILGMEIGGHKVERVLIEQRADIKQELYAAVLNDSVSKGPLVLFSTLGGMDIEQAAATKLDAVRRHAIDIRTGFDRAAADKLLAGMDLAGAEGKIAEVLARLYEVYRQHDAELVEINPLALTATGEVIALDCKFVLDDSAIARQQALAQRGVPERLTDAERRSRELGLRYIELEGNVGVLANGAGLTMTTMDAVRHYGGQPANFLEIGGEAYTLAKPALELVLDNPRVKSLVINFCGAFARTDVMMEGVVSAWQELKPNIPVFFSVHGTGEDEAVQLLRERLQMEPFDLMDDAVKAAVEAAQ
jgi:succinyl-CoA synthetase beta subunit